MKPVKTFITKPVLPKELAGLTELAYNLYWAWDFEALSLFRRLDSDLWEACGHNPVQLLGEIDQQKLRAAAENEGFRTHLDHVMTNYQQYMQKKATWYHQVHGESQNPVTAYFSAEFGLTECLSIFAGGLGILAGDHLKSASDLGIPLIGVGLLYQQGYFRQQLNEAGVQIEIYEDNDFYNLPITRETNQNGEPVTIQVDLPNDRVHAHIWRAQVGRVSLYLLDTNVPENSPAARKITYQLYGGDLDMRIRQEIVLGMGGYRALKALRQSPTVYHINEGHSAFLALEHIIQLMVEYQLSYSEAVEAAKAGIVFTTHTPVAAGHDYFPPDMMRHYFKNYLDSHKISFEHFLSMGQQPSGENKDSFCMTVFALRMASRSNGVSKLHGEVSRTMWQALYEQVPIDEVPIEHITNGIHFQSWISHDMKDIYDRYLGERWREEPADITVWQKSENIPTEELWRTHERRRERLVVFTRNRLRDQLIRRGASESEIDFTDAVLDTEALTIGFARRFATYKRAHLILRDERRLAHLLNDPQRPMQIIFAGKAHPKDEPGQELVKRIIQLANQEELRRKIVFIEDYDMTVTRYLVQGADIWLNTPRRPREASGTSGMKAAANGVLNLSILDGWWDEAYYPEVGWAFGGKDNYQDREIQDKIEAEALYSLLEREVVPTYYDRSIDGLPRKWIAKMKKSIGTLSHFFNTHRMVGEYTEKYYIMGQKRCADMARNNYAAAKELAQWKEKISANWPKISIVDCCVGPEANFHVGEKFSVKACVQLGALAPQDVGVELYLGRIDSENNFIAARAIEMKAGTVREDGTIEYTAKDIKCIHSGQHGYTVRVLPRHKHLTEPFLPGFIVWAKD
ncbi:alpha-glucan family phosphorylase [candidate division KSB1 bacterium]|nr:alpha-glucan family phosphorylase [candidate division KSB1 bacterium]